MYLDGQNLFKRGSLTWFAKSPKNEVILQRLQRSMKQNVDLFSLQSSIRLQKNLRRSETLDTTRKDRILDEIRAVCREFLNEIKDGSREVLNEIPRETMHPSKWSKLASGTAHSVGTILKPAIVVVGEASKFPYLKGLAGIILLVSNSVQVEDNTDSGQFSLRIQSLNRAFTWILQAVQNNKKFQREGPFALYRTPHSSYLPPLKRG
ncbi:hypothetical protein C8J57DRAFT_1237569 [Mycena rebaudengoi]|nr:hypothetical protein C8J57DRAFT_1237569 [Mycena rebaudengoi]